MPKYPSRSPAPPAVQNERVRRPVANPPPSMRLNLYPRPYVPTHSLPYPPINHFLSERMSTRYMEHLPYPNFTRFPEILPPESPNILGSPAQGLQLPIYPQPLIYCPISQEYTQARMFYTPTPQGYNTETAMELHGNPIIQAPLPTLPYVAPQNIPSDQGTDARREEYIINVDEPDDAVVSHNYDPNPRAAPTLRLPTEEDYGELAVCLVYTVSWVRNMTAESSLEMSERIELLRSNWRELVLIIAGLRNITFNEEQIVERLIYHRPDVRRELAQIMSLMNRFTIYNVDRDEFQFLQHIILYRTESPHHLISSLRDLLLEHALEHLLRLNNEDLKRFGKLLFLLPSICGVAHVGLIDHLVFKTPYDIDAVLTEWFGNVT